MESTPRWDPSHPGIRSRSKSVSWKQNHRNRSVIPRFDQDPTVGWKKSCSFTQTTTWKVEKLVFFCFDRNFNYRPQLVIAGFLNHPQDFIEMFGQKPWSDCFFLPLLFFCVKNDWRWNGLTKKVFLYSVQYSFMVFVTQLSETNNSSSNHNNNNKNNNIISKVDGQAISFLSFLYYFLVELRRCWSHW